MPWKSTPVTVKLLLEKLKLKVKVWVWFFCNGSKYRGVTLNAVAALIRPKEK